MGLEEKKISDGEKNSLNVKSVIGSRLKGTVQENKNVFDKLVEFLITRYNELIDEFIVKTAAGQIGAVGTEGGHTDVQTLLDKISEIASGNVESINTLKGVVEIVDGGGDTIRVMVDDETKKIKLTAVGAVPKEHGSTHAPDQDDPISGYALDNLTNVENTAFKEKAEEAGFEQQRPYQTHYFTELDDIEIQSGVITNGAAGWNIYKFPKVFSGMPNVTLTLVNYDGFIQIDNITETGFQFQIKILDIVTNRYVSSGTSWSGVTQNIVQGFKTTGAEVKINYTAVFNGTGV